MNFQKIKIKIPIPKEKKYSYYKSTTYEVYIKIIVVFNYCIAILFWNSKLMLNSCPMEKKYI